MSDDEISIGVLARETGLTTATINFYVQQGVLPPPRKLSRTRALYNQHHQRLIPVIRRMQAQGLSLAQIRTYMEHLGMDEAGIQKLESIGNIQPLAPPRGAPDLAPIEPFKPEDRETFLARAGIDAALLDHLERIGVLRPRTPGRYDHADLWLIRSVQAILADGIEPGQLACLGALVGPLLCGVPLLLTQVRVHAAELRARELRVRDLLAPWSNTTQYLFDRLMDEVDPHWREMLYGPSTAGSHEPDAD